MHQLHASALVTWWIGGLAVVVAIMVAAAMRSLAATLVLAGMMGLEYWLASTGRLLNWQATPPNFTILMVVCFVLTVRLAFSRTGNDMIARLPYTALIGFQGFRLVLEIGMHRAAIEGTMPVQMSYLGYNFDILTGASAIVVAILAARGKAPRGLLVAWNLLGSILLAAIIAIAFASTPMIRAFGGGGDRLNTFVGYVPFVWLPCVLVQAALLGHILVWRKLARS